VIGPTASSASDSQPPARTAVTGGVAAVRTRLQEVAERRERRTRLLGVVLPLVPLIVLAVGWELYANELGSFVFPPFSLFLTSLVALLGDGIFWDAMILSNQALVVGFLGAAAVGVPIGLAMGRLSGLKNVVDPFLNLMLVVPSAMYLPLVLIALGVSFVSRATVVFIFALPFIVVPCIAGVRVIDRDLISMSRTFGAGELQLWKEVLVPGALSAILSGLRQGLAHALTGMVVVELTLMAVGVGQLLQFYGSQLRYEFVFAIAVAVILEAVLAVGVIRIIERRVSNAYGRVTI